MCSIKLRGEAVLRLGSHSDAASCAGDGIIPHPNYSLYFQAQSRKKCYRFLGMIIQITLKISPLLIGS